MIRAAWQNGRALQISHRRGLRRIAKFAVVGASGFVVDFAVLDALILLAGWQPVWANTCSFSLAVTNTFIWNRLWTFPESRQRSLGRQLIQFFLVNLVGLGINQLTFLGSASLVWGHLLPLVWSTNLAKMTASGVALIWNYSANRLWTWRGIPS
jgi:putative flippase GtrA